ncbi:glycoside hydrolase family 92 protein [Segetibacter sp. 3557_3]|uniref:GH92 family glycosyl hydrolase n=1 Tax=Segetibacter sp. 3557_3 TaxID=2547429 RepID=UPI0010584117|nr:GH92 family glycosyl hydrolase [Segetibacter sp. 3557_3]TDH28615.1 glycoside hydrolase family 92 protein [Segetibacter sp. 3557_3]
MTRNILLTVYKLLGLQGVLTLPKLCILANCLAAVVLISVLSADSLAQNKSARTYTRFVDPYIGTGFHGHVFLGANVPFGGVQLGPVNMSQGWDWCSGYHYSDSTIIGFSHTHLSGTGIGDLGDILIMPFTGQVLPKKGSLNDPASGYYSLFSHHDETAKPGYYGVKLKRYDIDVALTATKRVGFHNYTFPASQNAGIVIDLKEGIGWDLATQTHIRRVNDSTIEGYRYSRGWAQDQRLYFAASFSKPFKSFALYEDSVMHGGDSLTGRRVKAMISFATFNKEQVMVKVGISPVSITNAFANIKAEVPHWNFNQVVKAADADWNRELRKIEIKTKDTSRLKVFYTALYHTMIAPSIFNDSNGDYRGTDKKTYKAANFTNLTTFSLWDTYRAAHPLFTLYQRDKVPDMINSMLAIYQQQGKLPVWHLMANETNTMPGYSAVQVITDAYLKGIKGFDADLAWEAVKTTAMQDERGLSFVKQYGFIPADSMTESVAMGLEYAIADWGIAQMAKRMGKAEDHKYFTQRAANYKNYFNAETGFMRGRISEKAWRDSFSPFQARHMKDDFTEGNAWQYTWLVPQDVEGLIQLQGGEGSFTKKLDSLFIVKGNMGAEASPDISGLIGQYAHGNEPSHHITYLYNYVGQPWKTADKVRFILDSMYSDRFDGLSGNEDVGQMSAWYVLSAIGLYQANPMNGKFLVGSPVVDEAILQVGDKKTFTIKVQNNSSSNKYIQRILLNDKPYSKSYVPYKHIIAGGKMTIEMGNNPSSTWGVKLQDRPFSALD